MAYPGAVAPRADECLSKVTLYVECKNLIDKDALSKSDPCAVLYMSRKGGHFVEVMY